VPKGRTEKLLYNQKQRETVDSQHVSALMDKWVCHVSDCGNGAAWCYVVKGVHLQLLAQHLRTWSIAINNSTDEDPADITTAPRSLAESLRPTKAATKNPLCEKPTTVTPTASASTQATFAPIMQPPYPFFGYPPFFPYQQQPHPPHYVPQATIPAPPEPPATVVSAQCSSPVLPDRDDSSDNLDEYFNWLTKLNPTKADGLSKCLQVFKEDDIVIGIVDKMKDEHFDS
jgi:hypothetical protein